MEAQTDISATIQARIQDFELACPNIYLIYDLLQDVKRLVLWNHSRMISMTWDNNRIPKRSFSDSTVLMMYQNP